MEYQMKSSKILYFSISTKQENLFFFKKLTSLLIKGGVGINSILVTYRILRFLKKTLINKKNVPSLLSKLSARQLLLKSIREATSRVQLINIKKRKRLFKTVNLFSDYILADLNILKQLFALLRENTTTERIHNIQKFVNNILNNNKDSILINKQDDLFFFALDAYALKKSYKKRFLEKRQR